MKNTIKVLVLTTLVLTILLATAVTAVMYNTGELRPWPSVIMEDGTKVWYYKASLHRVNGPARISTRPDTMFGYLRCEEWFFNGVRHRENGPALVMYEHSGNVSKQWYINDLLHRENGPAIVLDDGYKAWFINGKRHRENGPAVIEPDIYGRVTQQWFINGIELTEREFNAR